MKKYIIEYSNLMKEWDWEANNALKLFPDKLTGGSGKKVNWICKKNPKHCWPATIVKRTAGKGCPYCRGFKVLPEESFGALHPKLLEEWNDEQDPFTFAPHSNKKVNWKCLKNPKHVWEAIVNDRVRVRGRGCSYCDGKKVLPEESFGTLHSKLLEEWNDKQDPFTFAPHSNKKVNWKCLKNPKHCWPATINNRILGKGCPYCSGQKVLPEESFGALHPKLLEEWDDKQDPFTFTFGSKKKVNWKCSKNPKHCWPATIGHRVNGNGCPYCRGFKVLPEESFGALHPDLLKEWNDKQDPFTFAPHSNKKVNWKCLKNPKHCWPAIINSRAVGHGCPHCSSSISNVEKQWINSFNDVNILTQQTLRIGGKLHKPDGFNPITNTVYEFYGDYFHGNPRIYKADDYNKKCKAFHGELYQKTLNKEQRYKSAGYNLITIWEKDFKEKI
jgi:hypothetical protein